MKTNVPDYCQVLKVKGSDGTVKELYFPKALDLHRPKRPRTTFSSKQLTVLESEFEKSPYLVGKDRRRLAEHLQLSETQIKVWYQNRRTKKRLGTNDSEVYYEPEDRHLTQSHNISPQLFQTASQMNTTTTTTPTMDPYKCPANFNDSPVISPPDWLKMAAALASPNLLTTDANLWKFAII